MQPPADTETLMFREAAQAAGAIALQFARNADTVAALAERLRQAPPRFVVTCARGSSDHAATYAKYLFETRLGLVTASASPSVGSVYSVRQQLDGALYLLISQSGRSPDLLRNAEAARAGGAYVVALVNDAESPLAALADCVLPLHAGPERSVAATKSYLCSLAALLQLTAHWSGDETLLAALPALPDALSNAWRADWTPLVDGLVAANDLFVLGRGLGLGAAQEMALKLKETCGLHAEAYSAAEVRHGPMAIIGPGFPLLCITQPDETDAGLREVVASFRESGARAWLAAQDGDLPLPQAPHPACAPLLAVQALYRAANALSLRRGFNPDVPPHLRKVTETL
ncbi:MAG TPA: SIS domain-containing protein [Lysobacter sp.]|nr:SIS domain-containing protein [Lysobacter sp.]